MKTTAVILAAGQGTRMRSKLPKVLHPLAGKPMLMHSIDAAWQVTGTQPVVVVGHGADGVRAAVGDRARFVVQDRQLGTANAVLAAEDLLRNEGGLVLVMFGDMPLLRADMLTELVNRQQESSSPMVMTSVMCDDPHGFGRILRAPDGAVTGIVEEAVATPEQLAIRELNVSAYCFKADWLWPALHRIGVSPKGEYYLTDIVELAVQDGHRVDAVVIDDIRDALGVNNRVHLSEAETILRERINTAWMLAGVSMVDPASTYIEPDVTIGRDVVLYPNCVLRGNTSIGENCTLGPGCVIIDSQVGEGCVVETAWLQGVALPDGSHVPAFERLTG